MGCGGFVAVGAVAAVEIEVAVVLVVCVADCVAVAIWVVVVVWIVVAIRVRERKPMTTAQWAAVGHQLAHARVWSRGGYGSVSGSRSYSWSGSAGGRGVAWSGSRSWSWSGRRHRSVSSGMQK